MGGGDPTLIGSCVCRPRKLRSRAKHLQVGQACGWSSMCMDKHVHGCCLWCMYLQRATGSSAVWPAKVQLLTSSFDLAIIRRGAGPGHTRYSLCGLLANRCGAADGGVHRSAMRRLYPFIVLEVFWKLSIAQDLAAMPGLCCVAANAHLAPVQAHFLKLFPFVRKGIPVRGGRVCEAPDGARGEGD